MRYKLIVLLLTAVLLGCGRVAEPGNETATPVFVVLTATPEPTPEPVLDASTAEMDSNVMGMTAPETAVPPAPTAEFVEETTGDAAGAIALLAAHEEVALHLSNYPDWEGNAWPEDDNGIWGIDFYSPAADEWLGWGQVNVMTTEVLDYFVPIELSAEDFQEGLTAVENFVFSDPEVLALLGEAADWEHETSFNRWEQRWESWFWRGLDAFGVLVHYSDDGLWLDGIVDPNAFEAEEAAELARNQAIELAWEAGGVGDALNDNDNWVTYVSPQPDGNWLVEFVADETLQFYALVDIAEWIIVESGE